MCLVTVNALLATAQNISLSIFLTLIHMEPPQLRSVWGSPLAYRQLHHFIQVEKRKKNINDGDSVIEYQTLLTG